MLLNLYPVALTESFFCLHESCHQFVRVLQCLLLVVHHLVNHADTKHIIDSQSFIIQLWSVRVIQGQPG